MLAEITPHEFDELQAATCVGLDPERWWQSAHLAAALYEPLDEIRAQIETYLTNKSAKLRPKGAVDFMPEQYRKLLESGKQTSLERLEQRLKAQHGNSRKNDS